MPRYLLELYLPASSSRSQAAEVAREVASDRPDGAATIRYVRTLFVVEDETCFHLFDAPSRDALIEAASHAGLVATRVTEAIEDGEVKPAGDEHRGGLR